MMTMEQLEEDYHRVERAIRFIEDEALRQPSLAEIANAAGLSEFHFQRLFSRWVGISPKRFLQFLTKAYARRLLEESRDVLSVTYDAGLSSPGRLHELFVTCEAVTPGEVKSRGEGLTIEYGFHPSPFGRCMLAVTERGICGLSFVQEGPEETLVHNLCARWPGARVSLSPESTSGIAHRIFSFEAQSEPGPLHLFIRNKLSDPGLGGVDSHPVRQGSHVRGRCAPHRNAERSPGGRKRRGKQSDPLSHSLSPRDSKDGRVRQLRRGTSEKEGHPWLGGSPDQGRGIRVISTTCREAALLAAQESLLAAQQPFLQ